MKKSELIINREGRIIGRNEGNLVFSREGRLLGRYDPVTDTTSTREGRFIGNGDQRMRILGSGKEQVK